MMDTNDITGTLLNIIHIKSNCLAIETTNGTFEIDATNDCCGYSEFYLMENFNTLLPKCMNGTIISMSMEDLDDEDISKKYESIKFDGDGDEGSENMIFNLKVESSKGKIYDIYFCARSFHNGYYPMSISIFKHQTLSQLINDGANRAWQR